jgi:predicted O-methyltransferase YrrM
MVVDVMEVEQLGQVLEGIPHMTYEQGCKITRFILDNDLRRCLELGFAHGVGTAYIASAVRSLGGGRVVAVDLEVARQRQPDIRSTLRLAGLAPETVEIYFEPLSYTWRMMKLLETSGPGSFDFIYLDGAHAWETDGLAFYLGAKLLRPGGWILFDDLNWTFESPTMLRHDWVRQMPREARRTPQVRKIWDLLVKTDPRFDTLVEEDGWAYARKAERRQDQKVIYRYHPLAETLLACAQVARRAYHRLARSGRANV